MEDYKKVEGGIKTTTTLVEVETFEYLEKQKSMYLLEISLIQEKINKIDDKLNTK